VRTPKGAWMSKHPRNRYVPSDGNVACHYGMLHVLYIYRTCSDGNVACHYGMLHVLYIYRTCSDGNVACNYGMLHVIMERQQHICRVCVCFF